MSRYQLTGQHYDSVTRLLGPPTSVDSNSFCYELDIDYDGVDPDYFKSLRFEMNEDSTIVNILIDEWRDK